MEEPADQSDPVAVANAVDVQSPDRKVVRRRFVQQTLFPLKPHEPKDKVDDSAKKEKKKVVEIGDDEECCGSQGKRSRKRGNKKEAIKVDVEIVDEHDDEEDVCGSQGRSKKRGRKAKQNSTPQKRGSKKVSANGKDASIIALDDVESPDDGSPQRRKDKKQVSARNGKTQGSKGTSPAAHQSPQPVPNLWLEAKQTAEENSRLFAGKQVHPFFSAWKTAKKDNTTIDVENNGCLDRRKEVHVECAPIHVFESMQVDTNSIDWSNWTICEGIFSSPTYDQERIVSSSESIVGSLNFGADVNISKPSGTLLHLDDLCMGQCSNEESCAIPVSDSPIVVDLELTPDEMLKTMKKDFAINKHEFGAGNVDHVCSTSEQLKAVLLERIMSYYLSRSNHPENSLWTNKYQPDKALEVCGNSEAVKFINDWLHLWNSTNVRVSRRPSGTKKRSRREDDFICDDSDSDMESVDEEPGLKNVLLVTGPVGSGKSAAIYACAKEQGFQVIEVNASDWRTGAILKQKFGEAVESHRLKRSQETTTSSPIKRILKSSSGAFSNNAAGLDLNKSAVEVVALSEEEDFDNEVQCSGDYGTPCDKSEIKTVILFEDVDATLCEDRGFISTIQQLADTGKRPMILTCNSEDPVLPDSLSREEVCFTMPSLKELLHHIYLVCAAERANVKPSLIERCIHFCGGDIRRTLMHLQFWCQNKGYLKDGKSPTIYGPLMFNLEAGHFTLPKLIPWELPSSLAVFIEAEIADTFRKISMEENVSLLEVIEEEAGNTNVENNMDSENGELASIEAKKEAILRENCFHVDNDIIAMSNACDIYNSSDSPVAFARRSVRRKLGTILSDSEDDIPAVSGALVDRDNNCSVSAAEFLPVQPSAVNATANALDGGVFHIDAAELQLSSGTTHLDHFNLFPVGNSHKSSGHSVQSAEAHFAEIQHHLVNQAAVNNNNVEAANNSLNLFSDQMLFPVETKLEFNRSPFTTASQANQNSPIGNLRNQSTDHVIQYTETDAVETEMGYGHCCVNPLSDLSQHCEESKMEVKRCLFPQSDPINCTVDVRPNLPTHQFDITELPHQDKHPEIGHANPLGFAVVENSLTLSSGQLFCSPEEKVLEVQNQHLEPETTSSMKCTANLGGCLNQSSNQFHGIAKPEEIQGQDQGSSDVKEVGCPQEECSLKQMTHQFTFEEKKIESPKRQLPETAGTDIISCTAVGNSENLVNGKPFEFADEQQSLYSEATSFNHLANGCLSLNMSCVPESTFVPETEINDGPEFTSRDCMEIVSPLTVNNVDPTVLKCETSGHIQRCSDIDLNLKSEEMGDSQSESERPEPSTSGCQVMDECSRMDFCKRSKGFHSSRVAPKNPMQEKWNELRQKDLKHHFISENKNARQIIELTCDMSNLISEADLLLDPSRFPAADSLDQDTYLDYETCNFGWWDQQAQMGSVIAEHGYCLYAKKINSLQLETGMDNRVHLTWELLASTSNSMALGKLLRLDRSNCLNSPDGVSLKGAAPMVEDSSIREREISLQNMLQSIVPLRCHLALRGNVLHDYLSSMARISSSETSRLAEATTNKRKGRRARGAKNYLCSGGLDLSAEEISLLNEYNNYKKVASNSK